MFKLEFSPEAKEQLKKLENPNHKIVLKAVRKTLAYLENNPRHKSLQTHEFTSYSKKYGKKIYEAYAQNNTPGAYRIFFYYGAGKNIITILTITPHP